MKESKVLFIMPILLIFVLSILSLINLSGTSKDTINNKRVQRYTVATEMNLLLSLEKMIASSDAVVIGEYKDFISAFNVDRDVDDPSQESPYYYSEGELYTFDVSKVIYGDVSNTITICKEVSAGFEVPIEVSEKELMVMQKNNEEFPTEVLQIPNEFYIQPEYDTEYVLFLKYDKYNDIYYAPGEPNEIIFENNKAILNSRLFTQSGISPAKSPKIFEIGDVAYEIHRGHNDIVYDDFLTGEDSKDVLMKLDEAIELMNE